MSKGNWREDEGNYLKEELREEVQKNIKNQGTRKDGYTHKNACPVELTVSFLATLFQINFS